MRSLPAKRLFILKPEVQNIDAVLAVGRCLGTSPEALHHATALAKYLAIPALTNGGDADQWLCHIRHLEEHLGGTPGLSDRINLLLPQMIQPCLGRCSVLDSSPAGGGSMGTFGAMLGGATGVEQPLSTTDSTFTHLRSSHFLAQSASPG